MGFISAFLENKKIEMLKKVREEAEAKETRLKEIERLENEIDEHSQIKKKRLQRRIVRIQKLKEMICGKADKIPIDKLITDQTKIDIARLERISEADAKLKDFDKAMGVNNGVHKKEN